MLNPTFYTWRQSAHRDKDAEHGVLAVLKTEAERLGIPYQTYIGRVLYGFAQGELIDRKTVDLLKQLKVS